MDEITLKTELKWLEKAPRAELQAEWERIFGIKPPHRCSMDVLRGNLALHLQGGLSEATQARLRELYAHYKANPNYRPHAYTPDIKPGTKLLREWRGNVYEVMVLDKGYEFKGHLHTSLSEITRLITGTRWNGKRFFGIK